MRCSHPSSIIRPSVYFTLLPLFLSSTLYHQGCQEVLVDNIDAVASAIGGVSVTLGVIKVNDQLPTIIYNKE